MKGFRRLLVATLATFVVLSSPAPVSAAAQAPIHFADLNWESGSLITDILRMIVEKGYGLPTDTLPGTTITLETALANNDIQVIGEEWAGRSPVWVKAEAEGKVASLGDTVKGATEGWWVPEYVIKGDPAKGIKPLAPDLRKAFANLEHVSFARPHFLALSTDMLPGEKADEFRAKGYPIVAWTLRSPQEWDAIKDHCDNLIFEGFAA